MRKYLAYICGRLFIFFWDLCGRFDLEYAVITIYSMAAHMKRLERQGKLQANYRKAVKDRADMAQR
jgi:hypothetical protein